MINLVVFVEVHGYRPPLHLCLHLLFAVFFLRTSRQMRLLMIEANAHLSIRISPRPSVPRPTELYLQHLVGSAQALSPSAPFGWKEFYQDRASDVVDQSCARFTCRAVSVAFYQNSAGGEGTAWRSHPSLAYKVALHAFSWHLLLETRCYWPKGSHRRKILSGLENTIANEIPTIKPTRGDNIESL